MDTFMNNDTQVTTGIGEYPVTKSLKTAKISFETSEGALPTTTQEFGQIQTTTNEMGFNTQIGEFPNMANIEKEEFASVNELGAEGALNDVQFNQIQTNTNTGFTGFETTTTTTSTTNVMDTNAFTENTTTNMNFGANTETQFGEYQATSPIIDTAESAQITQNTTTNYENIGSFDTTTTTGNVVDTGATYNAESFQSVEPNVDLGNITTSTPAVETNNFDFTSTSSVVDATSALNNFDSTN